ncbi:bifunctional UDP-N-acetylglucosamine pyrophosphorylase/glucosamine-1-phosphate N-acetyltransferase [Methanofollis sp. W23]|uniref:bifunctional sugar-1-phosphate nucleotidylyltransferase/acetyltransferase n=1 Tax=Methanofollis sp. W23 TaxID=2817849 RepID=UPI001AE2C828|nr:bifunctional sugar-1-phosphate nucleotidylyltransferase/acetyltransferase [Methanofollis sp. W23]MBP2146850.1 bifunctional UDP-N-acetylglucosamine pyrophosphorylase/glucosamine-1-phosphate N-acetyltransferase [Methanofollis sp. W23]
MECVILAAGEGTRMRPLTADRPKVMLPIANRPMLEHLVCAVRDAGITSVVLVVGYGEREVRDWFGDGSRFGLSIRYVTQRHQLGTGDALMATEGLTTGRFLMLNGDMIVESSDLAALCQREAPCMGVHESDHPQDYGVVTMDGAQITGLEEKSRHPRSTWINAGVYLFDQEIYARAEDLSLSGRGEYELTDALEGYIAEGRLTAYPLKTWMDVGSPWDLLDANATLLAGMEASRDGAVEEGVVVHGKLILGKNSVVKAGTYIEGDCVIGDGCTVGPHAYLRGSTTIGDSCHIGHSVEVKNSIIFAETKIPHFNYLGDSVVGSHCNFGAGTKVANLRHDHGIIRVNGRSTGRKKFGAIIGDHVLFGINCSVNVGSVIGSYSLIGPHSLVEGVLRDRTVIR